jgi:type I restriction enzyme S subunit
MELMVEQKYKQTGWGSIPDDWVYQSIDKDIDLLTGFPFPSSKYVESGVRLLRCSNVKRGVTDWSEDIVQYWSSVTADLKPYALNEGDIVIAMDGSLVGRSFATISQGDLPALLLQRVARVRSEKIAQGYLKELICSEYFTKHCDAVKTSSAIPHISPGDIRSFKIPLPPTKEEQTAIAKVLSDTDALITGLEKLIAKKRNIKQGTMQELLRPKEGWVVKKLGDVCKVFGRIGFRGYTVNDIVKQGEGAITISPSNIQGGKMDLSKCTYLSWFKYEESPEIKIFPGDILLVKTGSTFGKTALVKVLPEKATLNPQIVVLKEITIDNVFLAYVMGHVDVQNQINTSIVGGAIPTLSQQQVMNFDVHIPNSINEQRQIAVTLSDMDNEIESLQRKLEKYKDIKQGMMQQLLTGKIRLV